MSTTPHLNTTADELRRLEVSRATAGIPPEEVRAHLQEVLTSKAFSMSRRCSDFLSFVVEQTLLGLEHELKERTIGIAVFGRNNSYDTSEDAVVRIKATETRKRLAMYYSECGSTPQLIISLQAGGYIPQFQRVEPGREEKSLKSATASEDVIIKANEFAAVQAAAKSKRRIVTGILGAVAVLVIVAGAAWGWRAMHPSIMQRFWKPVLDQPGPIYLVTSPAPVYLYYPQETPEKKAGSGHYVLTSDQFIGRGDMLASDRITALLQTMGRTSQLKPSDTINLREMSRHSVVLIGYASTKWVAISRNLRYFVDDSNLGMITNFGQETDWFPHHLGEDLSTDEDYALVARVYDPETRSVLVLVSGATQYGTEAAASLITNPELLSEALKNAPPDWEKKNIEMVIHVKIIGNTPAAPEIVAYDFR
jgi:hypothetical protein